MESNELSFFDSRDLKPENGEFGEGGVERFRWSPTKQCHVIQL